MKINEYQKLARSTAIYPGKCIYPALGLVGECGEFVEKLFYGGCSKEGLLKEAGDILWYMANLTHDCGHRLSICLGCSVFHHQCVKQSNTADLYVQLMIDTGRIAEIIKKTIRDNQGVVPEEEKTEILNLLRKIYSTVGYFVYLRTGELTLEMAAIMNVKKLQSRKERDKLKGDGDDR